MDKSCLLIGGGGFIGSHLIQKITSTGRQVTVLGRKQTPSHLIKENVKYVQGSFADLPLIQRLLDSHREVIHLAYASIPNTSFDNPLGDLLENLPPTIQLFSEVVARGNRLILLSSGGTVYGEALKLPITEEHSTRPISPYGVTKLTLEQYAFLYSKTHGMNFTCIRPSNAYGEGQRPFMGQGFVATAMGLSILGKPVPLFGINGNVRDYIHVEDLASGIVEVLDNALPGRCYNLSTGIGYSNCEVLDLLKPIVAKFGFQLMIEKWDARPFDVKSNILDASALKNQTNWKPTISLESGLERMFVWMVGYLKKNACLISNFG